MFAFRRSTLSAVGLAVMLALAGPAVAQGTPAPPAGPEQDVTVTGTLERDREIADFVRALTPGPMTGQLARFEEAICPRAMGLGADARAAVEARMRRVAEAVGLRLGGADCTPNILLMITRDKRALITALSNRHPQFFGDEPEMHPRRVAQQPGRASAWHATMHVNADGRPLPAQGGFLVNRSTRNASRIENPTRPSFIAAAVVIERDALPGLTMTQLADYAMMRALARTEPDRLSPGSSRTVLSVLEAAADAEVPGGLTRWDIGFLRGLYASTANLRTTQQRGEIQQRVSAELDGSAGRGN